MPALRDIQAIRALLEADRAWAAYALGDLAPGFFEHCSWFQPRSSGNALALLYRAFEPPVLFNPPKPNPPRPPPPFVPPPVFPPTPLGSIFAELLPPLAAWRYDYAPEPGSAEAKLYTDFLVARDWLGETAR
jgi:hypothetical protein